MRIKSNKIQDHLLKIIFILEKNHSFLFWADGLVLLSSVSHNCCLFDDLVTFIDDLVTFIDEK